MKTFLLTLRKTRLSYSAVMLPYILAATVAAAGLVVTNRLTGEMGEAALYGHTDTLVRLLLWVTAVMVLRAAVTSLSTFLYARFTANAGYALRAYFVRHFLRVPFARIERTASGENLSIYSNDIPKAEALIASDILDLITDFVSFVSAFIFLMVISPRFTAISFVAAIGMLVLQIGLALPLQRWSVRMSEKQAEFNAVVNDSLQNLSTVISYGLENVLEARYMHVYGQYFAALMKFAVSLGFMLGTMLTILLSPLIVIFTVLALATIAGELAIAEFIAFITTVFIAATSVTQLAQNVGRLAADSAGAKRLNENTDDAHEILDEGAEGTSEQIVPKLGVPTLGVPKLGVPKLGEIRFNDVTFSYCAANDGTPSVGEPSTAPTEEPATAPTEESIAAPTEEPTVTPALDALSFTIKPGSRVAIVGASGSGKSTILKLLLGLYEPTGGTITFGGEEISQFPKSRVRDLFAYVPQDSFLFPESIGKNITLEWGQEAKTDNAHFRFDREREAASNNARLRLACEQADILGFIDSLPEGFDAILGESAENISGGQRQRIAMARAFYKDAPIILFDEATASLDPSTEAEILKTLDTVTQGKTVIMVSHRPQTIAACDLVITMDDGKIREAVQ
ncbi:MAG: ATP-binding cassette domain-containing protein [Defluviitaleaceae bacterium]|nr:ATP-binding cassette domain-containing protein [Defluviitaleaceae bacterium]